MAEKIFNDLTKGMVRKVNPLKKDQNLYNFALNISTDKNVIDRVTKVNENKLEDYYSLKNVDYLILNSTYLGIDEYVYFITDKLSTFSEIVYYNKGQITTKYNNSALNFKASNIIDTTYRVNYAGDRLIYFVDGENKDRVINIDKVGLSDNIESLSISPVYGYSNYLKYNIINRGNLKSGEYSIFVSYLDENGKESAYKEYIDNIAIENGIYSNNLDVNSNYLSYINSADRYDVYGLPENSHTNKSIEIEVNNTVEYYKNINIYVILKHNTNTEVFLLENIPLQNKIIISDLNNYESLGNDVSAVIVDNIIYNSSEAIAQKENRLILANTKLESHNIDFQSIANQIKVKAVNNNNLFDVSYNLNIYPLSPENPGSPGAPPERRVNSHFTNSTRNELKTKSDSNYLSYTQSVEVPAMSFMRDDVYALGVYFELDNGVFTDVYHIPGRAMNDIDTEFINGQDETGATLTSAIRSNWDNRIISHGGETGEAWKIINTATTTGLLGYHQCDNSMYPYGYGFPSGYIRHHRIPSDKIFPIITEEQVSEASNTYIKRYRNYVNLEFYNINIPTDLQDKVVNIYFCSANRDEYNKKVIDKGIIYSLRENRNSELLNRPVQTNDRNYEIYEFTSPNVDFRFKEFNIKADKLKINSIYTGNVGFFTKRNPRSSGTESGIPYIYGSFLNYEGIDISTSQQNDLNYSFKQETTFTRVNYFTQTPNTFYQVGIDDIIFTDNNSIINFTNSNDLINLEGNQNSSLLKLNMNSVPSSWDDTDLLPGDNINSLSPIKYKDYAGVNLPSYIDANFYFPGREIGNSFNREDRRLINGMPYFDSTHYITLLSDNNDIFTNLLQLTYTRIIQNENDLTYQGDCYIENHTTKKSFSCIVPEITYSTIDNESILPIEKDAANVTVSGGFPSIDNIDTSISETYITYPVETRLNIRIRRHDGDNMHYPYTLFQSEFPYNELEKKAGSQEVYTLDSQYLNNNDSKALYANTLKIEDLQNQGKKIGNRLIYSELQNNESYKDNFRVFLANNYKDIITTKGNINKLFIKNNNLFILTRDSLLVMNSSNNYLNTRNGTDIYVGTGEFFGVEPEELISLETGFAGTISKLSFSENKFGYVFVDSIRNKIILFNENLNDINTYGLYEDLSINLFKQFPELNNHLDNPLLGYGILTGFDPETDRIFVTKHDYKATNILLGSNYTINDGLFYIDNQLIDFNNQDYFENKSFTVTYDAVNNIWISYHDYFPTSYIPNPAKLNVKLDNNFIQKYGDDYTDNFIIDILFNEHQGLVKVFDSLQFDISSESSNGEFTEAFFDELIAYTQNQSTGLISLNSSYPNNNLTRKETYWNFSKLLDISDDKLNKKLFLNDWNSIKDNYFIDKVININDLDINKDWYKKKRFRDKLINVRLFKNNTENNKFTLNFGILNYRPSIR